MYMDSNLKAEVISSLFGQSVQLYDKNRRTAGNILTVDDFHLHNLIGRKQAHGDYFFIDVQKFFDPVYDYDFTHLSESAECKRGNELYKRPKGWYRMALKVKGRYPDGDTWLGEDGWRSYSVPGEWPVSYHGTSLDGAKGIIQGHYKAGDRALYGRGIYSTPDIEIAEKEDYAKTFTSQTTGKSYKVILQNRINPDKREICRRSDYWLIPVDNRASPSEEQQIVEGSIRPYGILIQEIKDDDDDDDGDDDDDDDGDDGDDDDDGDGDDGGGNDDGGNDDGDAGLLGTILHSLYSAVQGLFN